MEPIMKLIDPFLARKGTPGPPGVGRRLSIDPGVRGTGWALWSTTGFLLACGLHEPPWEDITRVAIEVPRVYRKSRVDPNDLITLAFLAGRYVGKAQSLTGFTCEAKWCWPHEWKGDLDKDITEARARKKLTADERLVVEECERYVPRSLMNNVWDAIGIGLYAWRGGIS